MTTKKYQPQNFEQKWIDRWGKEKTYKTASPSEKKKKMYILDMFPYPSGAGLHVGHPRGYTASDILARYYRMNGYAVLHPMGWDAFGLPAENAAIKAKKNPIDMVPENIANFKRQMKMLGFSYDWKKELATSDPSYYRWTQWLFIQFFKMGLLYKKNIPINFCPFCKTGLAEEEVLPNGTHERCGNPIIKKDLPQWIFRITTYADRLLNDLQRLDWPQGILEMQKNWIGKKEGINITYNVINIEARQHASHLREPVRSAAHVSSRSKQSASLPENLEKIASVSCFTTRPETNFGATFIVVAPEHELVKKILDGEIQSRDITPEILKEIDIYVQQTKAKTEVERMLEGKKKTGVFTRLYALNNLNNKLLPIWISDFVLAQFGTGAVVGVPGHDLRDFEFAQQLGIEVLRVVVSKDGDTSPIIKISQVQEEEGKMINSGFLNDLDIHEATKRMMDYLEENGWGKRVVTYHLRDWIFSRQRYWGEPIPMVYCENCAHNKISYFDLESKDREIESRMMNYELRNKIRNWKLEIGNSLYGWFPLEDKDLPLKLPYVKSYEPTDTGESPLARIKEFTKTVCPHCSKDARRETDTMPNWAGSCWYFLRFIEPQNEEKAWDKNIVREFFPVDWYIGGAEHAVLHLLYARFWVKALNDLGLLEAEEPFVRLRNVGMILAEDHRKMSKSWGNVINPDNVVKEFGADSLRTYEMFMAPFSQEIAWSTNALQGVYRFLIRVWTMYQNYELRITNQEEDPKLVSKLNKTIQKVTNDILDIKFNTAIASMMEFLNEWDEEIKNQKSKIKNSNEVMEQWDNRENDLNFSINQPLSLENAKKFLKLLAPFAPFTTEEIWREILKESNSIHLSDWPEIDKQAFIAEEINIPVQVNGKVRAVITVDQTDKDTVVKKALENEKVAQYVNGNKYEVIYVLGKILNFVINN